MITSRDDNRRRQHGHLLFRALMDRGTGLGSHHRPVETNVPDGLLPSATPKCRLQLVSEGTVFSLSKKSLLI